MGFRQLSRDSQTAGDQKMIEGIQKYLSQLASLPVGNTSYTPSQLVQMFQDRIASRKAATDASAQRTAAIKVDLEKRTATEPTASAFRKIVQGMFSQSPDILATFGLSPTKVVSRSVDVKKDAVAKAKATRAARHTMGPKQKAKIHGSVTDPVGAAPSPEPVPATPSQAAGSGAAPAVPAATAVSSNPAR